jgi:hypothetical protein
MPSLELAPLACFALLVGALSGCMGIVDGEQAPRGLTAVRQLEARLQSPLGACEGGEPPRAGLGTKSASSPSTT